MNGPQPRCEAEAAALCARGVDGGAIEALLATLPLLGPLRVVANRAGMVGAGEGWVPPRRWRLLDPWLGMLRGRAASVEADARVEPWGVCEWLAVRSLSQRMLIRFELLPATDFCEWERLFQGLGRRRPLGCEGPRGDSRARIGRRLRPLPAVFTGRVEAALAQGEFRLRLLRVGEPAQA